MSAANDGADAASRIAAVARRLIFIAVLVVLPAVASGPAPNSTPPAGSFHHQPHLTPFPRQVLVGQIRAGMRQHLGDGDRGHRFPVRGTLSLQPIPARSSTSKSISASRFGSSTASASSFR